MKTIADLAAYVQEGNRPVIRFRKAETSCLVLMRPTEGLQARVTGVGFKSGGWVSLNVDFKTFAESNQAISGADVCGPIYLPRDEPFDQHFELADCDSFNLYAAFKRQGASSYIAWLEQELMAYAPQVAMNPMSTGESSDMPDAVGDAPSR